MRTSTPQLLGFAEPVANIPPIEEFLPPIEEFLPLDAEPVLLLVEPVWLAPPEPAPPLRSAAPAHRPAPEAAPPQPVPAPPVPAPPADPVPDAPTMQLAVEAASEPVRIRARVRDLPPADTAPPLPIMPERPTNLVGRLGRRLGENPLAADGLPRFETVSPSPTPPLPRGVPERLPPAREIPEPAQTPASPGSAPVGERVPERAGRPSLARNRRLYRRATLPAEIEIDGVPCTLIDVSIGGFAATGVPPLEPNAVVPIMLRLTIDGIEVGTLLKARVVYVTPARSAGRFIELSPSQMAFLRYIVTWRGESVGAAGTTTLLDAISTGAGRGFPRGPGEPPDPEMKSRWWAGLIGRATNPPR